MPNCVTLSGLTLDCRDNVGGIKAAYLAPFSASIGGTVTANNSIGTITLDGGSSITAVPAGEFKKFELPRQTGFVTETGTFSEENGTAFYTQTLSLTFNKLTSGSQAEVAKLGTANKLAAIVVDNNDRMWMVGNKNGVVLSAANGGTGTAFGDRNGVTLEFTGISDDPMYLVTGVTAN